MRTRVAAIVLAMVLGLAPSAGASGMGPIARIAPRFRAVFTCIIWTESRSTWAHPNLTDVSRSGSSGIFQMEPALWERWSRQLGIHVPLWRASVFQQERVAVEVMRHDGFSPWKDGRA